MKQRCENKNDSNYKNYGARGIYCCKEWDSFSSFKRDMLGTWAIGLSLDRIDNNGPYSKQNCRWATIKQQANNKRTSVKIAYQGKIKTMSEWAECFNINRATIRRRHIRRLPLEMVFSKTPLPNSPAKTRDLIRMFST